MRETRTLTSLTGFTSSGRPGICPCRSSREEPMSQDGPTHMKDALRKTSTMAPSPSPLSPEGEKRAKDEYRTLLAISDALIAHRDISALLRDLAGRLRQVVE